MQRQSSWRIILIAAITVFSILFLYPTFHYFIYISGKRPTDKEQLSAWLKKADELRKSAIPLGLDIQGGVDVVLEMDMNKALLGELEALRNQMFRQLQQDGISAHLEVDKGAEGGPELLLTLDDKSQGRQAANMLNTFYKEPFQKWDAADLEQNGKIALRIKPDWVNYKEKDRIDGALKIIRDRVSGFGLTQAVVTKQGQDRVRVQMPGEKDPQRVVQNLVRQGRMSFHLVHPDNFKLREELFENKGIVPKGKTVCDLLEGKQLPAGYTAVAGEGPGHKNTALGEKPPDVMYLIGREELGGEMLTNAFYAYNPTDVEGNFHVVHVEFNKEGSRVFRQITKENCRQGDKPGRLLAIVLDNYVYSAPELLVEIPDGRAVITGHFTQETASDLAKVLKYGALPADLRPGQSRTVEATLGADSIAASLRALWIGSLLITIFMIGYYGTAGVFSIVALILNILILLALMRLSRATLTLSGIGGILLTVGMAVDTNVLIYERMREELRGGKPMKAALAAGFNRAFSVIIDSHMTTMGTALILLQFGEGSVRGFALTMVFGLLANLYTGLIVTYTLCESWFRWQGHLTLGRFAFLVHPTLRWIRMRGVSFSISGLTLLFAIIVMWHNGGPNFAIDFKGGLLAETVFTNDIPAGEVDKALDGAGLKGTMTQKYAGGSQEGFEMLIRVPLVASGNTMATEAAVTDGLTKGFGAENYKVRGFQSFTSEVGQEFSHLAWVVVACGSVAILLYLWFRFELVFGVAAVIALLHDLVLTTGILTVLHYEVSLDVVSALMILLGYSVNDTIVIFDRVRELARETYGKDLRTICDDAMNQCLARTLITSSTVFVVMCCMLFLGGITMRPFALVMVIGSIVGTYSSDFIAAPLVYEWTMRRHGGKLALAQKAQAGRATAAKKARAGAPA
ncbi:MAG: protein translocase subunit SecD [Candidatus Sumerlaeota bacterium]|nr:protein translocase subunit SecD [Candidatus Sumerlaeota bacterium]